MSLSRDTKDLVSGLLLAGLGIALFIHAVTSYRMGNTVNVGPGVWPAALGAVLCILGLVIAALSFTRRPTPVQIEWRSMISVFLALTAFALLLRPLGLVPAIFALVALCALADKRLTLKSILIASTILSLLVYVIFVLLLSINLPLFNWGF